MTGMLIRKIELQAKCSSSSPPSVGPMATPSPETADQMPIAFARSAGSGEHAGQDRQGGGHHERGARAHHRTRGDQLSDAAGQGGDHGAGAEDPRGPLGSRPVATVTISERTADVSSPANTSV